MIVCSLIQPSDVRLKVIRCGSDCCSENLPQITILRCSRWAWGKVLSQYYNAIHAWVFMITAFLLTRKTMNGNMQRTVFTRIVFLAVWAWLGRVQLGVRLCHICIFGPGVSGRQNRSGDPGVSLDRCDQSDHRQAVGSSTHSSVRLSSALSVTDEKSQEIIIG